MKKITIIIIGFVTGLVCLMGAFVFFTWAPDRPVEDLKARWAPPPSEFIEIGGVNVHLRDEGPRDDTEPIVLLHGTSSSLHTWEGWAQAFKTQRRVIRFDLPGFGLTGPSVDHVYTIESYSRFVAAMLDRLNVSRCVLAGNSFGGYVAWATSLAYPERVTKLILVDASGEIAHRIPEVNVPTLLLWGGRDRLIPPTVADSFQRQIIGSQLVIFDTLGHVPQEEDPARTVAAVKRFLSVSGKSNR